MNERPNHTARTIRRVGVALLILWVVLLEVVVFIWMSNEEAPMLLAASSFIALSAGAVFLVIARVIETQRR